MSRWSCRHPPLDLDLTLQQMLNRVVDLIDPELDTLGLLVDVVALLVIELVVKFVVGRVCVVGCFRHGAQFILGHAWPSGSIGAEHHWHSGLPDSITWPACLVKAAA